MQKTSVKAGILAWVIALFAAGNAGAVLAASTAATGAGVSTGRAAVAHRLGDDELVVDEVFQSHLPTTLEKYALRLSVNPHLGDYVRKDHLRMTTSLRYGLSEKCEISASSNLYFSHGNGGVRSFENYGTANLRLGVKIDLGQPLFSGWNTAIGLNYEFPTGVPPPELTDGWRHLRPYATFSHRLELHPDLRIFLGLRLDDVTRTSVPGQSGKNAFNDDSMGVTGGFVIDRNNWHYTFEASVDTTRLIGRTDADVFTIRPGVLWEIPTRRDPQVISHWMVGVAVIHTYGPGGNSLGASFKVRYSRDLKSRVRRVPVTPGS